MDHQDITPKQEAKSMSYKTPSKDLQKFSFNFSDSEQEPEQENSTQIKADQPKIKCESFGKLQRIKSRCPSLRHRANRTSKFQMNNEQQDNPEDSVKNNSAQNNHKCSQNDENQEYEQVIHLERSDRFLTKSSIKKPFFAQKSEPIQKPRKRKYIPQQFVFQQQQEEVKTPPFKNISYLADQELQSESPERIVNVISNAMVELRNQGSLHTENDSENLDEEVTNCQSNVINIFRVPQEIEEISCKLTKAISKINDKDKLKQYLRAPIPEGTLLRFEVHKYKQFTRIEYHLWTDYGSGMKLHAVAICSLFNIEKDIFDIKVCLDTNPHSSNNVLMAKLVSDFKRQVYTCYNAWQNNQPPPGTKIHCSIVRVPDHFGIQAQDILIPKLQNNQYETLVCSNEGKTLRRFSQLQKHSDKIQRYRTHKVPQRQIINLKKTSEISTNTTRNGVIKNTNDKNVFSILKVSKNRFKVASINPMSPLQLFCYSIVHLT